jgi:hypothetical protein
MNVLPVIWIVKPRYLKSFSFYSCGYIKVEISSLDTFPPIKNFMIFVLFLFMTSLLSDDCL